MSESHDSNDISRRVHDAIHMNVDLMDGPPRIVERALEVAGQVRRRRRRRRALAGALLITATVGTLAGVAVATRDEHGGITVTAGSSSTTSRKSVWTVKIDRAHAIAIGRERAGDPATAIVTAKLASWAEIQAADPTVGTSSDDDPGRRVWAISISGAFSGRGGRGSNEPYRWAVVFVDASTIHPPFATESGSTGDVAPWFAALPDHGA
jgi:hypothetical protein